MTEGTERLRTGAEPEPPRPAGNLSERQEKATMAAGREMPLHFAINRGPPGVQSLQVSPSAQGPAKGRVVTHGPARTKTARRIKCLCNSLSWGRTEQVGNRLPRAKGAVVAGESLLLCICVGDSDQSPARWLLWLRPQVPSEQK